MGRRRQAVSYKRVAADHASGRGTWNGDTYVSGLRTQEVPSRGLSYRVSQHLLEGGIHNLLSGKEWACFLDVEFRVLGLRRLDALARGWVFDQYAFPLDESLEVAREIGVRHPAFAGVLQQIRTDVVGYAPVDGNLLWMPFTCKVNAGLNRRAIEKLEIERRLWRRRGAELELYTESDIAEGRLRSLELFRPFFNLQNVLSPPLDVRVALEVAWREVLRRRPGYALSVASAELDRYFGIPSGGAQTLLLHLLAHRVIEVDFSRPFDLRRPVSALTWLGGK